MGILSPFSHDKIGISQDLSIESVITLRPPITAVAGAILPTFPWPGTTLMGVPLGPNGTAVVSGLQTEL